MENAMGPAEDRVRALVRIVYATDGLDTDGADRDVDALIAEVLQEAAEKIRSDMERQGAGGQYDMGMKRSVFLIDPDKETS